MNKIRYYRKKKNIKQQDLAENIGISSSLLSNYESGKAIPTEDKLQLIANILDVSPEALLSDDTKEQESFFWFSNNHLLDEENNRGNFIQRINEYNAYFSSLSKSLESVGERISFYRERLKMSQKELADQIGVSPSVVSRYEQSKINPPIDKLDSISQVLGVPISVLTGEIVETNPAEESVGVEKPAEKNLEISSVTDILPEEEDKVIPSRINDPFPAYLLSGGKCELCGNEAPFQDPTGHPYLEIHYVQWIKDGGSPTPNNMVALCPNCHKKIHLFNDQKDLEILKRAASQHYPNVSQYT